MKNRILTVVAIVLFFFFAIIINFAPLYYSECVRHRRILNLKKRFNKIIDDPLYTDRHLEILKIAINNYDSLANILSFDDLFQPDASLDKYEYEIKNIKHKFRIIWQTYMLGFLLLIVSTFFLPPFVYLFKLSRSAWMNRNAAESENAVTSNQAINSLNTE